MRVDNLIDFAARYPDRPGYRRRDTSKEAADAIAPKASSLQVLVLDAIRAAGALGLTAHECAAVLRLDRSAVQPRTTELSLLGFIRDSGARRHNTSGKRAIVWCATDKPGYPKPARKAA